MRELAYYIKQPAFYLEKARGAKCTSTVHEKRVTYSRLNDESFKPSGVPIGFGMTSRRGTTGKGKNL